MNGQVSRSSSNGNQAKPNQITQFGEEKRVNKPSLSIQTKPSQDGSDPFHFHFHFHHEPQPTIVLNSSFNLFALCRLIGPSGI